MLAFEDMAKLARPGTVTECLPDEALSRLLVTLARENRPGEILRVLTAMQGDWRPLPAAALMPLGLAGSSFLTSWVPAALDSARSMRNVKGALPALHVSMMASLGHMLPRDTSCDCACINIARWMEVREGLTASCLADRADEPDPGRRGRRGLPGDRRRPRRAWRFCCDGGRRCDLSLQAVGAAAAR